MTTKEIYQKAFDNMEDNFTSNQFLNECRRLGLSEEGLRISGPSSYTAFLLKRATRDEGKRRRVWVKDRVTNYPVQAQNVQQLEMEFTKLGEAEAIEYLKSMGYKVMKPCTEWQEC